MPCVPVPMAYHHFVMLIVGGVQFAWGFALHSRGVIKWEPLWVIGFSWLA